jgi:hypothetical protein
MTYEEAQEKVRKLLRKSQGGSTPEESALFAAKAQEIMDKYNIETVAADLESEAPRHDEPIQNFDREPALEACQKDSMWTIYLTQVVAEANGCKMYLRRQHTAGVKTFLIGRASDSATARYMIGLLANEVRRLNREHALGYSEKYRRDFKYGVVDAIAVKLREQWKKTTFDVRKDITNHMALVRVNNAIVKLEQRLATVSEWEKQNMKYSARGGHSNYSAGESAREHGQRIGKTIEINRARGGITSGAKALKG